MNHSPLLAMPSRRGRYEAPLLLALFFAFHPAAIADETPKGAPAGASSPAAVRAEIPQAPSVPKTIPFGDRVEGRHLIFDIRDAYQLSPSVAFSVKWSVRSTNGAGQPDSITQGTESVSAELEARRLAISMETTDEDGTKQVRRAFTKDGQLTATFFDQRPNAKNSTPRREVMRVPVDEGETPGIALRRVQIDLSTRAGHILTRLAFATIGSDSEIWRDEAYQTINGIRAATVNEVEPLETRGNATRLTARRYTIDSAGKRLLRFEMWQVTKSPDRARPARGKRPADDGTRIIYRVEDYSGVTLGTAPLAAALYDQTVPDSYVEKPAPGGDGATQPPPPSPEQFAPKAMALLDKWRRAQERLLTLKADIDASYAMTERTDLSRPIPDAWKDTRLHYTVSIAKPSQARIVMNTVAGGGFRGRYGRVDNQTSVSDGSTVRIDTDGNTRTADISRRNEPVWNGLRQAGINDWLDALSPVFEPPPDVTRQYDHATYDGPATLPSGEPAEAITLTRDVATKARRGRDADTSITMRILFGRDGLPRRMEQKRVTQVNGLYIGDQPPKLTIIRDYKNLTLDTPPSPTAFILPADKH